MFVLIGAGRHSAQTTVGDIGSRKPQPEACSPTEPRRLWAAADFSPWVSSSATSDSHFSGGILLFHDGAAWLAQIAMFVMLGLLVYPSQLLDVAVDGLIVAAAPHLRRAADRRRAPAAMFGCSVRQIAFVSWVGLKGAVPIGLATYPLMLGLEDAAGDSRHVRRRGGSGGLVIHEAPVPDSETAPP